MKRVWLLSLILLLVTLFAGWQLLFSSHMREKVQENNVLLEDHAQILDSSHESSIVGYHSVLLADYDIDYRVVTVVGITDLNHYTNRQFASMGVGSLSQSGLGLMLVISPDVNRVRLEVGPNLEGVYTDAFVSDIERNQMVPFFRKNRIADGVLATTELMIARAQAAYQSGAFNVHSKILRSTGAGAVVDASIGIPEEKQHGLPDVSKDGSPGDVVDAYIRAMAAGNSRPDLDIYTTATREMLRKWVVTPAQMRNVVREHASCTGEQYTIEGDRAVVQYDRVPRGCNPYFLRHENGAWRLDLATMQKYIRFDTDNDWHMPRGASEFSFAFPGR